MSDWRGSTDGERGRDTQQSRKTSSGTQVRSARRGDAIHGAVASRQRDLSLSLSSCKKSAGQTVKARRRGEAPGYSEVSSPETHQSRDASSVGELGRVMSLRSPRSVPLLPSSRELSARTVIRIDVNENIPVTGKGEKRRAETKLLLRARRSANESHVCL